MRRSEQERFSGRKFRQGSARHDDESRGYGPRMSEESEWEHTEDHFGTGHHMENEKRPHRNSHGSWSRSGMHSSDYSRPSSESSGRYRQQSGISDDGDRAGFSGRSNYFSSDDRFTPYRGNFGYGDFSDMEPNRLSHFGKGPKGYKRSDERIREDVCEALYRDHSVDASEVEVEVKDANVVLKGTVSSREAKRAAEYCVEHLSGVEDVRNEIRVNRESMTGSNSNSMSGTTQFKNQKLA